MEEETFSWNGEMKRKLLNEIEKKWGADFGTKFKSDEAWLRSLTRAGLPSLAKALRMLKKKR